MTAGDREGDEATAGGGGSRYGDRGPRRGEGRRTWGQRFVIAAGCLVTVALAVSASSLTYVYDRFSQLPRVELSGVLDDQDAGAPQNFLMVGVDNAATLDEDDPVRRGRGTTSLTDTIMILRIDPESRQAALLSLPRDLWIPIPGTGSSQRINSAMERGGPELLIETIGENFGIPINHYVQVDFASFQGLVEAVDGVPIYNPRAARDRRTGLYIPDLGCVTLDPAQALAYVRSRHYEQLIDGEWEPDLSNDLGRIQRQQAFIQRALSQAIDKGARDPQTLDRLIGVALDGIAVDDRLTGDDIFRLGNRFRSFEPQDLFTYSVPVVGDTVGEAQVLRLVEDEAEPIFDVFRGGAGDGQDGGGDGDEGGSDDGGSGGGTGGTTGDGDGGPGGDGGPDGTTTSEPSPESVVVQVFNGSGASGQAGEASSQLAGAGFAVVGTGEMPSFDDDGTVVRYPSGRRDDAELVARWLEADATLEESSEATAVEVVTGADWAGVRDEPRAATSGDGDGDDGDGDGSGGTDGGGDGGDDEDEGRGTTITSRPTLTTAPPDRTTTVPGETTSTTEDLASRPC